jgi:two-component system cell cycle response regulator DivK
MPVALIVDDDARNRKLARDVLAAAGVETLEASTGAETITLANDRAPDVILLDLRLPDTDGFDVARRLRDGARTAIIPIVAMSATSLQEASDRLREAGFAGAIDKPIDVATFPDEVKRFCAG